MTSTEEQVEKMAPTTKEEEEEEEMEEVKEETEEVKEEMEEVKEKMEEVKEETEEAKEEMEEVKEKVEKMPPTSEKTGKKRPLPKQQKEKKKEAGVLNLNNEVVKMRKEVKKVRAMVIQKLTRQISALRKKKGKEMDLERNLRRAARLLEEIHEMKALKPDQVSKTALQTNLSFEMVCKNPSSTISDRAMARIAAHPLLSKKIQAIQAAVKAFKDDRMKGGKQGEKKGKAKQPEKITAQLIDSGGGGEGKDNVEEEGKAVKQKEEGDEVGDGILKESENATFDTTPEIDRKNATTGAPSEMDREKAAPTVETADIENKEMSETQASFKAVAVPKSIKTASAKNTEMQNLVKNTPQINNTEKKPNPKPAPTKLQRKVEEDEDENDDEDEEGESDLDSESDPDDKGEKEYFDDSTEERFRKQYSQSDDSDGEDDFFLGKVRKFKKKKSNSTRTVEGEKQNQTKSDPADPLKTTDKGQSELDKLESRLNSKATKLKTVFCSSLSGSKLSGGWQSRGGRGRGGGQYRGRGGQRGGGPDRFSNEPSGFQKQMRGTERKPGFNKDNKHYYKDKGPESEDKGVGFAGRGRGRGRGDMARQQNRRGAGAFSHRAPEQALHPSWEASRKRKEQQTQIMAFQGKKIKFDDD